MKKALKWIFVIFIGACVFIGCSSTSEDNDDDTSTKTTESTTQEETKEETVYHIGDVVTVGDVEYTVNGIEQTDMIGDTYFNATAQNHFLVVSVTITNKGNEALSVSSSYLNLKNGEKTYEASTDASVYMGDENIIYESINPDASLTGKVAYDITQETIDSPDLQLQVQTGAFGTEKGLINLK